MEQHHHLMCASCSHIVTDAEAQQKLPYCGVCKGTEVYIVECIMCPQPFFTEALYFGVRRNDSNDIGGTSSENN